VWVSGIRCDARFASELSSSRKENDRVVSTVHRAVHLRFQATRSRPVESREDRGLFWRACDYAQPWDSVGNRATVVDGCFVIGRETGIKTAGWDARKGKLWMTLELCTSAWG
jgi:hypothetical protein